MNCPICMIVELKPDPRQPLNKNIATCTRCKKNFEVKYWDEPNE